MNQFSFGIRKIQVGRRAFICVTSFVTKSFSSCTKRRIGFSFCNDCETKTYDIGLSTCLRHISSQKLFRLQLTFFVRERRYMAIVTCNVCSSLLVFKNVFVD